MSDLIEVIKKLRSLDVNSKVEQKQKLKYLSWTYAWDEVLKNYPTATYEIIKQDNGLPYVYDPNTGYMVFTKLTIEGLTHEMWLFVMDGANKAMKHVSYNYTTKYNGEKTCEAAASHVFSPLCLIITQQNTTERKHVKLHLCLILTKLSCDA